MIRKNLIYALLFTPVAVISMMEKIETYANDDCIAVELPVNYGNKKSIIQAELPYPYKKVYLKNSVYIPAGCCYVIDPKITKQYFVVGGIKPYMGIFLRNQKSEKIIAFNKYFFNDINSLIAIAKKKLDIDEKNSNKIDLLIHTFKSLFYEKECAKYFEKRTQKEELLMVAKKIQQGLNLNFANIKVNFFHPKENELYMPSLWDGHAYNYAECTICINKKFMLKSSCLLQERIGLTAAKWLLVPFEHLEKGIKINIIESQIEENIIKLFKTRPFLQKKDIKYGNIPFICLLNQ